MLPPIYISIISRTPRLSLAESSIVASAIQYQVITHFQPIWGQTAVVTALDQPQQGYLPIFVVDDITIPGMTGFHTVEQDGTPYAVVEYGTTWSLLASHECLEMIIDPAADRKVPGPLVEYGQPRQVDFILEVCDPCQANPYKIGNVLVSDFFTPAYFEQVPVPGKRYSFTNKLSGPRQILPGGTLAWIESNGHAIQASNKNGQINLRDCGPFKPGPLPARQYMSQFENSHKKLINFKMEGRAKNNYAVELNNQNNAYADKFNMDMLRGENMNTIL